MPKTAAATAASPRCCEHTPGLALAPSLGSAYRAGFKGHVRPRVSGQGVGVAGADLRGRHSPTGRCRSRWPGRQSRGWWPAGSRRAPRAWGSEGWEAGTQKGTQKGEWSPRSGSQGHKVSGQGRPQTQGTCTAQGLFQSWVFSALMWTRVARGHLLRGTPSSCRAAPCRCPGLGRQQPPDTQHGTLHPTGKPRQEPPAGPANSRQDRSYSGLGRILTNPAH